MIFGGIALKLSTCSWFNPCPSFSSVAADDRKQFHCLNIIRNNKNWSITFGIQRKDNKRFASMFVLFQASTYQMGVLLMFNNSDSLTLEQIQEQTQLKTVGVLCWLLLAYINISWQARLWDRHFPRKGLGRGSPNLPPPVTCIPGYCPFFLGFFPLALKHCCLFSLYFFHFPPL